jgi:neutral trehalase
MKNVLRFKMVAFIVLIILFVVGCNQTGSSDNEKEHPYEMIQNSLASGWNTFNTWNSLSYVYMPMGFEIAFDFKYQAHNFSGYLHRANFIEGNDWETPKLKALAHAYDGSYTRIQVDWENVHAMIETATDGDDFVAVVSPMGEQKHYSALVVRTGLLFNRKGRLFHEDDHLAGNGMGETISVHAVTDTIVDYAVDVSTPYFTFELDQPAALSTGSKRSFEEVKAIISARKKEYENHAISMGQNVAEAYKAMSTILSWNTIYEPNNQRVLSTVSRTWNIKRGGYGLFCWDNFFMAYMCALDNRELAFANVIELLNDMTPEGFVPNNSQGNGRQSFDRSQPPVGGIITKEIYKKYPEKWFLEAVFDKLLTWNRWWMNRRYHKGMLCWGSHDADNPWNDKAFNNHLAAALESGLDDSPMYEDVPFDAEKGVMLLHDVGLNSLYTADCFALAEMATVLGKTDVAEELTNRGERFREALQTLWNDEAGIFMNRRTDTGEFNERLSPTLFYPLIAKAASPEQAERMIDNYFFDEDYFGGDYILPSIARNDAAFPEQRYWKGAVWAPLNFLVYLGLRQYDLPEARTELADKSLKMFLNEWDRKNYISENYSAFDGTGDDPRIKSHPFYSWGALMGMISMIENGKMPPVEDSL